MFSSIGAFIAWLFTKAFGFYLKPSGSKPVTDPATTLKAIPENADPPDFIRALDALLETAASVLPYGRGKLAARIALTALDEAAPYLWPAAVQEKLNAALAAQGLKITKA